MEERVKTSFIPKTSLQAPEARHPRGNPVALANLVCGILLVLAVIGAGGIYAFQQYTNGQIVAKQQSLALQREAFQPATIEELSRLDTRIDVGESLLSAHLSTSKLFDELEKLTLSSVRYSSFDYSIAPGHAILSMSGEAASFNAVAEQSEAFAKSTIITDPIFSNVNVGPKGTITFNFTAVVDTSRMLYDVSAVSATSSTP
jgi:hypothetical protein